MESLNKAIERIKSLECPTGELEKRIISILEEYNIANKDQITVNRDRELDSIKGQGYKAVIQGNINQEINIFAKSGMDDYVAVVMDAYIQ